MDGKRLLFAGVAAMLWVTAADAHHGAGAYDVTKTVSVTGQIKEFDFINPHVLIYANVEGKDGKMVTWSGELTSPNRLARGNHGVKWNKTILQPGDTVTLTGNPARNGAPSLRLQKVVKSVNGSNEVLVDDMDAGYGNAGSSGY